ncbi:hypothetical protein B0A52_01773 [Exophiala mesophila]|uniref:Uncharacterized protein n=1 Tax=Exophiala mesophila TaxID=212818 RepID=A0A438NG10_EXOME|nr:hypothetical protein B0A52_01773 [Exophiala mesophila]
MMASPSPYTTYPPSTPTPPWPSAMTSSLNQHRSNLSGKRKATNIDVDEYDPLYLSGGGGNSTSSSSISSQFKKLRLNNTHNHTNHYQSGPATTDESNINTHPSTHVTPVSSTSITHLTTPPHSPVRRLHKPHGSPRSRPPSPIYTYHPNNPHYLSLSPSISTPPLPPSSSSFMPIDDTPHRIVIHDLDAEIALIEAEELAQKQTVFLPDIDKKVSSIPQQLLQNRSPDQPHISPPQSIAPPNHYQPYGTSSATSLAPSQNCPSALVLYKDPTSISVPEEEDVVRKTIIEARKRAREKAVDDQRERDLARQRFLTEYRNRTFVGDGDGDTDFDDAMTDQSSMGGDDDDAMEIE